ncbi:alpha/beta family hydrolase [Streptomyces malaysiense]|uniref:Alpha/beta hydrolase n=1 Tax=Streptomyces malaysiense TaxID=1428626 RepID=A0A1J4Q003_9ACTN|nr:alpha/beta family hydrolase [Streptomyces malaysiense]OIK26515.1 alpha/beta hydrolase [Streptomyces malaysiense]
MSATSALVPLRLPARPRAAVLVLPGGRAHGLRPSRPWHLAVLRMRPFHRAIAAALPHEDVLLAQVRYRVRGWNDGRADPVPDTLEALRRLGELAGPVPTVLVGHSMGGRAALRAVGHPQVRALLALAPWWPPDEPWQPLAGRRLVVLHGERDRITAPADSAGLVCRARGTADRSAMALVRGGDHAMVRRHRFWHETAAAVVAHFLDPGTRPDPLPPECYDAGPAPVL